MIASKSTTFCEPERPAGLTSPTEPPGDCRFLADCVTYSDPLIPRSVKCTEGRGCLGQDDAYRKRHCRVFACRLLCRVLKAVFEKRDLLDVGR